jgi:hypothetical protein
MERQFLVGDAAMHQKLEQSAGIKLLSAVMLLLAGSSAIAGPATVPMVGTGGLRSLSILPEKVTLRGADQVQQLVVTGHYANDGVRDVTQEAVLRAADPTIVGVERGRLLVARKNGVTEVTAEMEGKTAKVAVTVEGAEREQPINFANEIVPIFGKLGCNAGACHGKASGQNGFKLSLLGFDPEFDYTALTREGRGRRVVPAAPEGSLLLRKPTGIVAHGGGKRLDPASRDYQLLRRWIRSGMPFGSSTDPRVVAIAVAPDHRLIAPRSRQQITVTAQYSDGSHRDVTSHAEYSSNDSEVVEVNSRGVVATHDLAGEGVVMVRYLGQVAVFRATIPLNAPLDKFSQHEPANFVDRHVLAKLKQLGIPPSDLCTDGEFLRRASLDITGTLPTAAEAERFLADKDERKREKLVNDLLERPAYASYFALKWCDILRNRKVGEVGLGGGSARTVAFHGWVRDHLAKNRPYDQLVREIITAKGSVVGDAAQPAVGWYHVLRTPQALVDDTAQAFLGTRLQCAQCHHHPYEKWSQDDYWGLAAFYARVQTTVIKTDIPKDGRGLLTLAIASDGKVASPQGKVYTRPRPLGGEELAIPSGADPREKLAEWMTRPDNPFLARALVNRYWAHFFGRGIVEMADDLRVTNPPSNPELLDALAQDFVEHKFDLKQLVRTICTSRTYQLSSTPNEYNQKDRQNFARYYPRRLPAEVLLDALDQVTGVPSRLGGRDAGARAIDLPDESVKNPLLDVFGKPSRGSACECERVSAATLSQSLYLITAKEMHDKLKDPRSRAGQLAASTRPRVERIKEIFLWVYGRPPTADELQTAETFLAREEAGADRNQQKANQWPYEDLLWALLNTKEFLFNH